MALQYSRATMFMPSGVGRESFNSPDVRTPWIMTVTDSYGRTKSLLIRYGPN